ncbi:hypothetical protein OWR29_02485 [Actinoplanes sp. Pm04-4]|uniref:Integral membrane protein n=1 Tax=Paractinoplanes pyxinae TaxID=2997416 RepID=A0ABT4ARH1_9ACTN|nr:hypothetical protein [Actinoplanes pyxinae]MCY1136849.1 hypothetical protein [Actinoplanes pyxinae]
MTTATPEPATTAAAPATTAPEPATTAHAPATTAPAPATEPEETGELARLRAEVAGLKAELAAGRRRRAGAATFRRAAAAILVALAAFALVTSVVGFWAARTTLNTERWVATVAPLPSDPKVAAAVSAYATDQLFQIVDVEQRLRTVLPQQAAFAAGPIAGQLREQVDRTVGRVLTSDRFQVVWAELNRRVHQRMMAVLEGESDVVTAGDDHIDIDLLPLINQALRELSAQLPTLFGKTITLPDLSSGAIPENLRARVEEQVGVTLPANFAQFTVYDAGRLQAAQEAVVTAKRGLVLFGSLAVLLLIAAYVVSPRRRRTTVQFGLWLVVAAVVVTAVLRAVRRQVVEGVPAGTYRDGVDAAVTTVFASLRERGTQIIWIGAILAVLAYLAGPGRLPVWLRRQIRRGAARVWQLVGRAPVFIAAHLDAVRIAGLIVAGVLALILTSWTALLVIVVVLAAYEVAVTLIARQAAGIAPASAGGEQRPERVDEPDQMPV